MSVVEETIEVAVPVRTAYDQWTQFESFPQFMEGVRSVQQVDDTRLVWDAEIYGRDKHWEAKIEQQEPDRLVAWRSTTGAKNDGQVRFEQIDGRTRIQLRIEADPDGVIENVGDHLGLLKRQVHQDLERFKEFIESSGSATGGWRGEIQGGQEMNDTNAGSTGSTGSTGNMASATGTGTTGTPNTSSSGSVMSGGMNDVFDTAGGGDAAGTGMSNTGGIASSSDVTSGIDSTGSSGSSLASDMTGGGSTAFRGTDASAGSSLSGTDGMTAGGGMPGGTHTLAGTEPTTGPTGGTDGSAGTALDETSQTGLGDLRGESTPR